MRKLAKQVPSTVSRLLQASLLQSPPTWYQPVLSNPPPVLPPRQTVPRQRPSAPGAFSDLPPSRLDRTKEGLTRTHKMKHLRESKPRPVEIVYPEDRIRRQFFRDFPFEALRPTTLVEGIDIAEQGVNGLEWTQLAQRGSYPTVESVIAFTLNLHDVHGKTISEAYAIACEEFVQLRSAHEMATLAAELEARAHGAEFKRDPFERTFALEERALDTLAPSSSSATATTPSTKYRKPSRWASMVPAAAIPSPEFTAGQSYVQRWTLPQPLELEGESEGDLNPALSTGSAEGLSSESLKEVDEVDDMDVLEAAIGPSRQA